MPASADDADELLDALDAAVDARLIVEDPGEPGDGYAFAHALVRQTLEDDLTAARRARLHVQAWRALEDMPPTPATLRAIAHHALSSGGSAPPDQIVDVVLDAAQSSIDSDQYTQATDLAQLALSTMDRTGHEPAAQRARALCLRGAAGYMSDDPSRGIPDLRSAVELGRHCGDPVVFARAAEHLVVSAAEWGKPSADLHVLREAIDALGSEHTALRAELLGTEAVVLAHADLRLDEALRLCGEAVESARRCGEPMAHYCALMAYDTLLDNSAEYAQRQELLEEATTVAERIRTVDWPHSQLLASKVHLAIQNGDPAFRSHLAEYVASRPPERTTVQTSFLLARQALVDGDFEIADRHLSSGLERASDPDLLLIGLGQLLYLKREIGSDEVIDLLDGAVDLGAGLVVLPAARALALSEAGRHDESVVAVRTVRESLRRLPQQPTSISAAVLLAEVVLRESTADLAEDLVDLLDPHQGHTAQVAMSVCVGSVDRALGQLHAALGDLEAANRRYAAAVAVESRLGAPPMVARTRYWWARALLAEHRVDQAEQLLLPARATAAELGMHRLLADCDALERGTPAPTH